MSHNQTSFERLERRLEDPADRCARAAARAVEFVREVRSGRGERRPQTVRAKRSNNPLELPEALCGKANASTARRWRDLARFYGNRLGAERLADEGTRAKLLNLIWLTLELERIRDAPLARQPPVHTLLHLSQEVRTLLSELGLNEPTRSNGGTTLADLMREGHDG